MFRPFPILGLFLGLLWLGAPALASSDSARYEGRGFAPVSGSKLFYEVKGEGDPVVLVHGAQLDSRMWDDQFEIFAREFRVLRYDLRGCGGSPAAQVAYSQAGDLALLLDYLEMPRAHLVGLSMGGIVVSDFAVAYPERVLSLVLSGPGISGLDTESAEEGTRFIRELRAVRDEPPEQALRLWLEDPLFAPAMENPAVAPRLERIARENLPAWLGNWTLQRQLRPPTATRLGEIKAPTLVIMGTRDLPSTRAVVDTLARAVPDCRTVFIAEAGHMVNLEKPAEFNEAVLGFLRKVKAEKSRG
jgi:pimeloyl-ACP methyl ester carboxylesterase